MADDWRQLGIVHGRPRFLEPLHVGCPNLGDREKLFDRLAGALDRKRLTNDGPLVREFEERIAALAGARHCVAMSNATLALQLCARGLGLTGEVILPSLTFIATAHALAWEGLRPVFCDVEPLSHNIDPRHVARRIGPRTSAIVGVHLWGRPCAVEKLEWLARRHGLPLLFDGAHALGCAMDTAPIGAFGTATVFSFHATKVVNCGEGGAVVTNDAALAQRLRLLRNFGFAGVDRVKYLGTNAKLSEFAAALGLTSLDSFDDSVAANRRNFRAYRAGLRGVPGLKVAGYDARDTVNYQYVIVEVTEQAALRRDELVAVLHGDNILARRYFYPGCHRSAPYQDLRQDPLPVTENLSERLLALPTGTAVDEAAVRHVCDVIKLASSHPEEIRGYVPGAAPVLQRAA